MQTKKQNSPISNMNDIPYVFCGFENRVVSREIEEANKKVHVNGKGVYVYDVPHCKHCNSRKVKNHGYTPRILYGNDGKRFEIKVQRYYCPECGKYSQTKFEGEYEPYAHYSNDIKDSIMNIESCGRISLRKLADIIKELLNHPISYETVRKTILICKDNYIIFTDIAPISGYVGFDTQWVGINSEWKYRHTLYDLIHKVPLAERYSEKEDDKTIEEFIKQTIPTHLRTGIVTDLKPSYNKIMDKLGFIHQHCQFHFKQVISRRKKEYLNKKEKALKRKYKKQGKSLKSVKKEMQRIKNKIAEELKEFYQLFNCTSIFEAKNYINSLIPKIKNYTSFLSEYLFTHFIPNYKKVINFMENPRLDSTNNQIENFFKNTLSRHQKKIFRTPEGLMSQIILESLNRIKKKTKNKHENKRSNPIKQKQQTK